MRRPVPRATMGALKPTLVRLAGLVFAAAYAAFIVSVYARQPRTVQQLAGGMAASVGAYRVDPVNFQEGLRFFRADQFIEARAAFERADPARQDATTQFYIAYSFYRQGWGRVYRDDALYRQGLEVVDRIADAEELSRALPAAGWWWPIRPCRCTPRTSCARSCSEGWWPSCPISTR